MARATRNVIQSGLSGSLDKDQCARQTLDGKAIISAKPDFGSRQFRGGHLISLRRGCFAKTSGEQANESHTPMQVQQPSL